MTFETGDSVSKYWNCDGEDNGNDNTLETSDGQ